tara:strand:+ start:15282 stop:15599 length:318 start_codon:yes stop_codon:yes gene_type:complete
MDWKEFFKPTRGKVIVYFLILLIFGVPAITWKCAIYPIGPDYDKPELHCTEKKVGVYNLLIAILESNSTGARTNVSYSPILIITYLIILYLVVSGIFFLFQKFKK